jgi:hypothetical protein
METIYFPACGFGFWYLFGKYEHIRSKQSQYILSGSSAGSLICICSLVKMDDNVCLSEKIARLGIESALECSKTMRFVNLHIVVDIFISKLFAYIDESDEETFQQLKRLRIQTTVFHWPFWFEKRQTTPNSLAHLKELCLASCHIPFVIDYGKRLTYHINGERHIDGGFIDYYVPHISSFNARSYNSLIIPSIHSALAIRDIAYHEPFIINRAYDGRVWIITPLSLILFSMLAVLMFIYVI